MARLNNAITFGSGFNITASGPIDSRTRVEYVSDLVLSATWPSNMAPVYDGLIVSVTKTKDDNDNDIPLGEIWILPKATKWNKYGIGYGNGTDEEDGGWEKLLKAKEIKITGNDVDS